MKPASKGSPTPAPALSSVPKPLEVVTFGIIPERGFTRTVMRLPDGRCFYVGEIDDPVFTKERVEEGVTTELVRLRDNKPLDMEKLTRGMRLVERIGIKREDP